MKKRILTLALVLSLLVALVIPASVALAQTTGVTGDVVQGSTFTAPTAIGFGSMAPGATYPANSAGSLTGNNPTGYVVDGVDVKGTNTGFMVEPLGPTPLTNKLLMGPAASPTNTADILTIFLTTVAPGAATPVPFFVEQAVVLADTVATGYTITITFTVTPNP